MELVDEQGLTKEDIKEKYKDSKFLAVLDISCMKNSWQNIYFNCKILQNYLTSLKLAYSQFIIILHNT